jgi:acetylornithine deacetylase/succinyl-diaminopimelate desuccinylase-like protein
MIRLAAAALTLAATVAAIFAQTPVAQTPPNVASGLQTARAAHQALAKDILKELVETNTTQQGGTAAAAGAMAARLTAAGFPSDVRVLGPVPERVNLVARLRGRDSARKPILVMAHLDVVDALPQDWTVEPFRFLERDGWFYGRGTTDDKDEAAIWTATLIRLRREGYVPDRDIVLMLTADEEVGGPNNGTDWLLTHHRALIDAGFALNEGGGGVVKQDRRLSHTVQASEKTYLSFELLVTNSGGHSSLPRGDNAIGQLAFALTRVAGYTFPVRLNDVTRAFFERTAAIEAPPVAAAMRAIVKDPADAGANAVLSNLPEYNARLRTTCTPTRIEGGHADNALPQRARAIMNCRIVPGQTPAEVATTLQRVIADASIALRPLWDAQMVAPSALSADVLGAIEAVTRELWPGVPVIPTMSTTATDAFYLRRAGIPVYGVNGIFDDVEDIRAHGGDERIRQDWFFDGLEFSYRLIKRLTGGT